MTPGVMTLSLGRSLDIKVSQTASAWGLDLTSD